MEFVFYSENLKNLNMTRPGTGPKSKINDDKNKRQEENMDTEEDSYSNTPAHSKYIKQAKNVSKSNADKQNGEVKVKIDTESMENTEKRKGSGKQKGIKFASHSENIPNGEVEQEKVFCIEKSIVVENGASSPGQEKKAIIPRTPKDKKKFTIESKDSKATLDKYETEKMYQTDNKGRTEFKYFNNVSLESRTDVSEDETMEESPSSKDSSTPTTEELDISVGSNTTESKYLKKKTSPEIDFRIYKHPIDHSHQPPHTPRENKCPINSYVSTNKSTYTVNVQAPPNDNGDAHPQKHGSPQQERKKVS